MRGFHTPGPRVLVGLGGVVALLSGPGVARAAQEMPASAGTRFACPPGLEVLVEGSWAESEGLAVEDTLRVGPSTAAECPARVAGTFDPPADPATLTRQRPRLLFHLPQLAELSGRTDEVDRFTLDLRAGVPADSVAGLLAAAMPGALVIPAARLADQSSATFLVIQRFHQAIAWITLSASGIFLACLMTLRVQQRRIPVAALRLTGISRRTLFLWLLVETTVIAVLGAAAGIALGHLASGAINAFYQDRYDTTLLFSLVGPEATIPALALAVALGVGAGCIAAAMLLRSDPLTEAGR